MTMSLRPVASRFDGYPTVKVLSPKDVRSWKIGSPQRRSGRRLAVDRKAVGSAHERRSKPPRASSSPTSACAGQRRQRASSVSSRQERSACRCSAPPTPGASALDSATSVDVSSSAARAAHASGPDDVLAYGLTPWHGTAGPSILLGRIRGWMPLTVSRAPSLLSNLVRRPLRCCDYQLAHSLAGTDRLNLPRTVFIKPLNGPVMSIRGLPARWRLGGCAGNGRAMRARVSGRAAVEMWRCRWLPRS